MTETSTLALNMEGAHSCCLIPRMAQLQYSEMAIVGVSIVTLTWGRGTAMWEAAPLRVALCNLF